MELKSAYDRFHNLVQREEGVVRNATLVNVIELKSAVQLAHTQGRTGMAELKLDVEAVRADVTSGLGDMDGCLQSMLADTRRVRSYLEGKIHYYDAQICLGCLIVPCSRQRDPPCFPRDLSRARRGPVVAIPPRLPRQTTCRIRETSPGHRAVAAGFYSVPEMGSRRAELYYLVSRKWYEPPLPSLLSCRPCPSNSPTF